MEFYECHINTTEIGSLMLNRTIKSGDQDQEQFLLSLYNIGSFEATVCLSV